jgi:hypothetical protein
MRPLHRVLIVTVLAALIAVPHRASATCGTLQLCGTPSNDPTAPGVILVDTGRSLYLGTAVGSYSIVHGRTQPPGGCANLSLLLGDSTNTIDGYNCTAATGPALDVEDGLTITGADVVGTNVTMHFMLSVTNLNTGALPAYLYVAFKGPQVFEETYKAVPGSSSRQCVELWWTVTDGATGEIQVTISNSSSRPSSGMQGGETENYRWAAHSSSSPRIVLTYDNGDTYSYP